MIREVALRIHRQAPPALRHPFEGCTFVFWEPAADFCFDDRLAPTSLVECHISFPDCGIVVAEAPDA